LFVNLIENIVVPNKRVKSSNENLVSLSFESDLVSELLNQLVEVVNFSSRPIISDDRKKKYSSILESVAFEMMKYRKANHWDNSDLTIVPLKGGSYFLNFLDKTSIHNKTLAIDCKRIPVLKRNSFCFGMGINSMKEFPMNSDYKKFLIKGRCKKIRVVELCVVSGMTTIGFLLYLKENNIVPEEVEIDTIAISQQGYESVMRFAEREGFKVKFLTGGVYYHLGNYYVSRRDELLTLDGRSVIGDVKKFLD